MTTGWTDEQIRKVARTHFLTDENQIGGMWWGGRGQSLDWDVNVEHVAPVRPSYRGAYDNSFVKLRMCTTPEDAVVAIARKRPEVLDGIDKPAPVGGVPTAAQIAAHVPAGGVWCWRSDDGRDMRLWLIGEDASEHMGVAFWDDCCWHSHASIAQIRNGSDGIINGRPGQWVPVPFRVTK